MGSNIGISLQGYSKIGDITSYIWCYHYILENGLMRDYAMTYLQENYRGIDVHTNSWSVRIGQGESKNWAANMYNNAASVTMPDYLSGSPLLFPTYTYEEEGGFVAQNVRGSYTRDDETTVSGTMPIQMVWRTL